MVEHSEGKRGPVHAMNGDPELRSLRRKLSLEEQPSPVNLTEDHLRSILYARRGREAALGRELFSDPAWDILLELYAARLGRRRMVDRELARSINLPASITARWLAVLKKRGLIMTFADVGETERIWVELSMQGEAAMKRLVDHWGSAFRSI